MSANRLRLLLGVFFALVIVLVIWGRTWQHDAELANRLQGMDRDVAAAKAAAAEAARSAEEAALAARKAWNRAPGSS